MITSGIVFQHALADPESTSDLREGPAHLVHPRRELCGRHPFTRDWPRMHIIPKTLRTQFNANAWPGNSPTVIQDLNLTEYCWVAERSSPSLSPQNGGQIVLGARAIAPSNVEQRGRSGAYRADARRLIVGQAWYLAQVKAAVSRLRNNHVLTSRRTRGGNPRAGSSSSASEILRQIVWRSKRAWICGGGWSLGNTNSVAPAMSAIFGIRHGATVAPDQASVSHCRHI